MKVTWLGHATTLVELNGVRLLTDPVLRNRVGPLVRIAPPVDVAGLGRVDAVLLSHLHADHADPGSLRSVGRSSAVVGPRGSGVWLRRVGVGDVVELGAGEEAVVGGIRIHATQAVHAARRYPLGPSAAAVGYVMGGSASVYFAGDTDLFPEMAQLRGAVDVALLPVWGWGPSLGPGHLDPQRAARAATIIEPRVAVPIHWGTLARGWPFKPPSDPARPAREFADLVQRHTPSVAVRILSPGACALL